MYRSCGALLPFALAVVISGCVRFHVEEDNWFRPEPLLLTEAKLKAMALPDGYVAEPVHIEAADGTRLFGLHVHAAGDHPVVLYLGGDTFRIAEQGLEIAPQLAVWGVDVMMLDYRGYGGSEGVPTINRLMSDAEDVLAYLRSGSGARRPVIVHGFSLGSFVGAELATRQPVDGLILESTATSVRDWADHQVPWYGKPFVRIELAEALESQSNLERIRRYRGPLLVISGGEDKKTPAGMSEELVAVSASPQGCHELVEVDDARHGDALRFPRAMAAYRRFVSKTLQQCKPLESEQL